MTENRARGEREIVLGGRSWRLAPEYRAMARIEAALNTDIVPLAHGFLFHRQIGVTKVTRIIYECLVEGLRPGDTPPKLEEVGAWILEAGLNKVTPVATALLDQAFAAPENAGDGSKKADADGDETTGSTSSA